MGSTTVNHRIIRKNLDNVSCTALFKCNNFRNYTINNFVKFEKKEIGFIEKALITDIINQVLELSRIICICNNTYIKPTDFNFLELYTKKYQLKLKSIDILNGLENSLQEIRKYLKFTAKKMAYWISTLDDLRLDIKNWINFEKKKYEQYIINNKS